MEKKNYQKELEKILAYNEKNGIIPSLLLHGCCAPCSSYVLEYLSNYFHITLFFYNPNITNREEYLKRTKEITRLIDSLNVKYPIKFVEGSYDNKIFFEAVKGHEKDKEGSERCRICFNLRLQEAAKVAKEGNYDYFTTTLTISPMKNSQILNEIGEKAGEKYKVKHLPSDFKKKNGYKRSVELSKKYDLYRQDYCGCIFSKLQRENDKKRSESMEKLRVGILGGTGMVGQRFISLLENHPWFEVVTIAASERSAGKTYEEAVGNRWKMTTPIPEAVKNIIVMDVKEIEKVASTVDFVFSAVDMTKDEIKAIEEEYAKTETPVVSNNSAHRWTDDVPMVVPEINPEHFDIIKAQRERLGTKKGFVAVKPNCSIQSYAPVLTAWKEFEPVEVVATTYQAISGAGKTFKDWPEMVENIIPYIGGEEEKSEKEPLKLWGKINGNKIEVATTPVITCQCVRVPVLNGHTAAVFVKFKKKTTKEQLIEKLKEFKGEPQKLELPSAPKQLIHYMEECDRPQVKADVDCENGMAISVGRVREDHVYDFKFIGLSHNTVRGAAGGAILCAESLTQKGYITKK